VWGGGQGGECGSWHIHPGGWHGTRMLQRNTYARPHESTSKMSRQPSTVPSCSRGAPFSSEKAGVPPVIACARAGRKAEAGAAAPPAENGGIEAEEFRGEATVQQAKGPRCALFPGSAMVLARRELDSAPSGRVPRPLL